MGKYIILLYFLGGRNAYHSASRPASASQPCKSRDNVPQRGQVVSTPAGPAVYSLAPPPRAAAVAAAAAVEVVTKDEMGVGEAGKQLMHACMHACMVSTVLTVDQHAGWYNFYTLCRIKSSETRLIICAVCVCDPPTHHFGMHLTFFPSPRPFFSFYTSLSHQPHARCRPLLDR
jgi:hypothetical protein